MKKKIISVSVIILFMIFAVWAGLQLYKDFARKKSEDLAPKGDSSNTSSYSSKGQEKVDEDFFKNRESVSEENIYEMNELITTYDLTYQILDIKLSKKAPELNANSHFRYFDDDDELREIYEIDENSNMIGKNIYVFIRVSIKNESTEPNEFNVGNNRLMNTTNGVGFNEEIVYLDQTQNPNSKDALKYMLQPGEEMELTFGYAFEESKLRKQPIYMIINHHGTSNYGLKDSGICMFRLDLRDKEITP